MNQLARFGRDAKGQIVIVFALMIVVVLAVVGAAVDYGRALRDRAQLQNSLDAAVIAGAGSPGSSQEAVARNMFFASLGATKLGNVQVAWSLSGSTFSGRATAVAPTSFMSIVGAKSVDIGVSASAAASAASSTKVCMMALSPTASPGLLVNSGVSLQAPACRIDVKSTANPAATFNSGSPLGVNQICVEGANIIQNAGVVPALKTGCATAADPFAGTLPTVTPGACTVSNQNYSGANTLSPGVYCGTFNFNGTGSLTLNPGLYVFKDAIWNLNSGWTVTGNGVTFYFNSEKSSIQINSGVNADISAPTSGTYADILMYEPNGLPKTPMVFNGSAGHRFKGLFYLPSRNATFNQASTIASESITLVFNTIILDTLDWKFHSAGRSIDPTGAKVGVTLAK